MAKKAQSLRLQSSPRYVHFKLSCFPTELTLFSQKRGAKAATEGEDGEEATPKAKKAKTPRKTKATPKVKASADEAEEKSDASEEKVKSEVEGENGL